MPTPNIFTEPHPPCCGDITPQGLQLAAKLDNMHVEFLWLADQHVDWLTGQPDRSESYEGPSDHTHCSAFAAAAAARLGVYLLHPPQHGQELLANAQAHWLTTPDAQDDDWLPVNDTHHAQKLANFGNLVLALYPNPDPRASGHIAVLRPSTKSSLELLNDGPDVIEAAQQNHNQTTVRTAFQDHPGAWPDGVRYYYHPLTQIQP